MIISATLKVGSEPIDISFLPETLDIGYSSSMSKARQIALRTAREQEARFGQHVGYARFVCNRTLGKFKIGLEVGEWLSDGSS